MSMIDLSASSQRELNPALQRALGDRSGAADLGGFLGMLDSATAVDKEAPANAAGASGNFGSAEPAQTPIGSPAAGPDAAAAAAAAASAAAAAAAAAAATATTTITTAQAQPAAAAAVTDPVDGPYTWAGSAYNPANNAAASGASQIVDGVQLIPNAAGWDPNAASLPGLYEQMQISRDIQNGLAALNTPAASPAATPWTDTNEWQSAAYNPANGAAADGASQLVDGVQVVPGAPGWNPNATALQGIYNGMLSSWQSSGGGQSVASAGYSLSNSAYSPTSQAAARSGASHMVDGVQLIPGAPGWNPNAAGLQNIYQQMQSTWNTLNTLS